MEMLEISGAWENFGKKNLQNIQKSSRENVFQETILEGENKRRKASYFYPNFRFQKSLETKIWVKI